MRMLFIGGVWNLLAYVRHGDKKGGHASRYRFCWGNSVFGHDLVNAVTEWTGRKHL